MVTKVRTMRLQQPDFTRYFVTIPFNFIKELKWIKGQELMVKMQKNKIIIEKKGD